MSSLNLGSLKDKIANKLKDNNDKKTKKNEKKKQQAEKQNKVLSEKDKLLKKEALELGATEEDIKLVLDGANSDNDDLSEQEFETLDSKDDASLKGGLQDIMKQMGFDNETVPDLVDDEDIEEAEEDIEEVEEDIEEEAEENIEEEAEENIEEEAEENIEEEAEDKVEEETVAKSLSKTNLQKEETEQVNTDGFISETKLVISDNLLISTETLWHQISLDPETNQQHDLLSKEQIDKLFQRGKEALEHDNSVFYDEFTKNNSQRKFMADILQGGTLNDKISALTLLIQESPIHNLKSLETLMGFCNKKSRNSILATLAALKDMFLNGGLIPDRKLIYFKNQNLSMMLNKKTLAIWYFEDFLKKFYFQILEVFEKLSHDPIIHIRMNVLTHVIDLLAAKPEQEYNLLRLAVNKLGDIDNKVSSKASYQLLRLQTIHPNMKSIIIDAIVDIALKKNEGYHTIYYSVQTLNQTILKNSEYKVANNLLKVYFTLFEKFLVDSEIAKTKETDNDKEFNTKKSYEKSKRKKNVKKGKKGGVSVKQEVKTEQDIIEEKNSKLFSAILTGMNRAFPFSNLPAEIYEERLDTLFKITHSSNFNTSIQALTLVFQVISKNKGKVSDDRYYRTLYESLLDDRLATSSKQGIYLNLLYKSLIHDRDIPRVQSFVKRILQVCSHWLNIGAVAGMLYLLMKLNEVVPEIKNLLINTPMDYKNQDDDGIVKEEENEGIDEENTKKEYKPYDPRKRDPKFSNAEFSSLWEITNFEQHFHPTIKTYANAFAAADNKDDENEELVKPDLGLYTLAHFLDRFVYRNFKHKSTTRGSSIMQPLGGTHTGSLLVKASDKVWNELPANTENWLTRRTENIKPDEKFFYEYFTKKQSSIKKFKKTMEEDDDMEDELDEDEVWSALVKSRPDVEDEDENSEDDMFGEEDFSMSEDDDEDEDAEAANDDSGVEIDMNSEDDDEEEIDKEVASDSDSDGLDINAMISGEDDSDLESEQENGEEEEEISQPNNKRNAPLDEDSEKQDKKKKRKAIKQLPTFASAEDYAQYLDDSD
ncbi:CBF-domain-containing protein [Hanseniaspora valbyensis NRRL Y-1626]|uniref:CBF-domain-containing protein n=1 Tax=Hanseniaspora valbyensis NRRL Y-1626 TaxID=766949 RepID=A0A1B7TA38_9ASCO|nr:CBF-domain-containing protein [Hanseniaspora valbyensis NRRL Y-1626]